MPNQHRGEFLYKKRHHFYFQRRIPADIQQHYRCDRVQVALGTKDFFEARRRAARLVVELEDQWSHFRDQDKKNVLDRFLKGPHRKQKLDPKPNEVAALYLDRRGQGKGKPFEQMVARAFRNLREIIGDRRISQYERMDAVKLRDKLMARGLAPQSVKRNLSIISTGMKLFITEHGLPYDNVFANVDCGKAHETKARLPFTMEEIRELQREAKAVDDEARWLLALLSDTGMRLSEGAGLAVDDVQLNGKFPHLIIRPHPWRSLKTSSSTRKVPLVGASLWAAKRAMAATHTAYLFPNVCDGQTTKGNSTSAKLNKWIKARIEGEGKVVHSFRHSMRDRLRAVECPPDIIDQIGGWTSGGVGQSYGNGYPLDVLAKWLGRTA